MLNEEISDQHTYVASELGVDTEIMNDHPYDLKLTKCGHILVLWHDQAPDGVIREGKLGSYTTQIRPPKDSNLISFQSKH